MTRLVTANPFLFVILVFAFMCLGPIFLLVYPLYLWRRKRVCDVPFFIVGRP